VCESADEGTDRAGVPAEVYGYPLPKARVRWSCRRRAYDYRVRLGAAEARPYLRRPDGSASVLVSPNFDISCMRVLRAW